ncbi:hypothetical protein NPIL_579731, partial [Nephila pilipes]
QYELSAKQDHKCKHAGQAFSSSHFSQK